MRHDLIDFHSHILPQVDDGSRSVEMSVAMLRAQAQCGVEQVVLTPHFYPTTNTPERFLADRAQAADRLHEAMAGQEGLPKLHLGAEVAYFAGISECDDLRSLCIEHSDCVLVELPMCQWDGTIFRELEGIVTKQNLRPVVAHVDRYLPAFFPERVLKPLLELPVVLQFNASFFLRRSSLAMKLLKRGAVGLLGSDCHDLTERAPNLGQAAERIRMKSGDAALAKILEFGREMLSL